MNLKRDDKAHLNIGVLVIIFLFCWAPMLYTHTATFANSALLLLCLLCFNLVGSAIVRPLRTESLLIPITNTALSVFVGALSFSFLIMVNPNAWFLLLVMMGSALVAAIAMRRQMQVLYKPGITDIVAFISAIAGILLMSSYDLFEQFSDSISNRKLPTIDTYYFTSLVTTLRKGGTSDAAYEVGSSVSYQMLGFFIPSALGNMLGISSHQALWGIAQPFYKLLALLMSYEVFYFFMRGKVGRGDRVFVAVSILLPLLLLPLHPLYVLRGKVENFVLICNGFIWPNGKMNWEGTVTMPIAAVLILFSMLLFFRANWKEQRITADKVFFTVCVALIIIAKTAIYVPYFAFIGAVMLWRVVVGKEKIWGYAVSMMAILVLSVVVNGFNSQESGFVKTYIQYGYLAELTAETYKRSNVGLKNHMIALLLIPVSYATWFSIRLLGFWWLVRLRVQQFTDVFVGAMGAIMGASALVLFVRRVTLDEHGKVLRDLTFDSMQAVSCSFYILSVAACIGMLYYFFAGRKSKWLYMAYVVTAFWCAASVVGVVHLWGKHTDNKVCKECDWYFDNMTHLKAGKLDDGLIVVNPFFLEYGVMLAGSDRGQYWTAMDASPGHYNTSGKNIYRWRMYDDLLQNMNVASLDKMRAEGVKYVVSVPEDSARLGEIYRANPGKMRQLEGSKWIYVLE